MLFIGLYVRFPKNVLCWIKYAVGGNTVKYLLFFYSFTLLETRFSNFILPLCYNWVFLLSMELNKKLSCIVLEDEDDTRKNLLRLLGMYPDIEIIGSGASVDEGFQLIANLHPDTAFFDINLIGGDIFSLLERLKTQGIDIPYIVIMTGFPKLMLTSINDYHRYIVQYIVKPIHQDSDEKLRKAVDALWGAYRLRKNTKLAAKKGSSERSNYVFIPVQKQIIRVDMCDLVYLEAAGSGSTYVVTTETTFLVDYTLNRCLEEILPHGLLRISRGNAINLDFVKNIDRKDHSLHIMMGGKLKSFAIGDAYYSKLISEILR